MSTMRLCGDGGALFAAKAEGQEVCLRLGAAGLFQNVPPPKSLLACRLEIAERAASGSKGIAASYLSVAFAKFCSIPSSLVVTVPQLVSSWLLRGFRFECRATGLGELDVLGKRLRLSC